MNVSFAGCLDCTGGLPAEAFGVDNDDTLACRNDFGHSGEY